MHHVALTYILKSRGLHMPGAVQPLCGMAGQVHEDPACSPALECGALCSRVGESQER
jgi:hypothetical protein